MKRTLLGLSLVAMCSSSFGQLKAIPEINPGTGGSNPTRLTVFKNKLVFFASDGTVAPAGGNEMWTLDSLDFPSLVYNINPGTASANLAASYINMAVAGGKLFFPANNGTNGPELYSWDGTNAPMMVKDINPGAPGSSPTEVVMLGNKVYFSATDGTNGFELWEHDPTYGTTRMVADVYAGGPSSNPSNLTVYNGKLYFAANEPSVGNELFVYDPATETAKLVGDINTSGSSSPQSMLTVAGRLYFVATHSTYGRELFSVTDTLVQRHTDVRTGTGSSINFASVGQKIIGVLNNMIYFGATDGITGYQLYKFDPKKETTSLVYNINPLGSSSPASFTLFNKKLYFSASSPDKGTELWSYDGMNAPEMVADIDTAMNGSSFPANFTVYNNALYFTATEPLTGTELYKYEDASLGVQNIRFDAEVKVYPNPASSVAYLQISLKKAQKLAIGVYDVAGKEVYNTGVVNYNAGNANVTLPVNALTTGTYIYKVTDEAGRMYYSGKLMKQ